MKLDTKRALVTGGTSGIGRAIALALAAAGARVMVCGTREAKLAELLDEHSALRGVICDVTEAADIEAMVAALDAAFGGLDILVHCAGIQHAIDFNGHADIVHLDREIAVNLSAPMRLTHALLDRLKAAPEACIVNVTSVLALSPKQAAPVYCATKAGLASWTQALRYQLEASSVRVMELVPPLVDTPMTTGRSTGAVAPSIVADACVDGLRRNRDRICVGKARMAHLVHRIAPSLLARKLRYT